MRVSFCIYFFSPSPIFFYLYLFLFSPVENFVTTRGKKILRAAKRRVSVWQTADTPISGLFGTHLCPLKNGTYLGLTWDLNPVENNCFCYDFLSIVLLNYQNLNKKLAYDENSHYLCNMINHRLKIDKSYRQGFYSLY